MPRPGCGNHSVKDYFRKIRGGESLPPRLPVEGDAYSFAGSLLAIGAVAALTSATATPLVLGSFGASCVLLFGYPENGFSQPRFSPQRAPAGPPGARADLTQYVRTSREQ
jgi:hypothetical protein